MAATLLGCSSDSSTGKATQPVTPGAACSTEGAKAPSVDGCNSCTCTGGVWACTEMACVDGGGGVGAAGGGGTGTAGAGGTGTAGAGGTAGAAGGGGSPSLTWYTTCGDPVCGPGGTTSTGETPCTTSETEGAACTDEGRLCDPGTGCGTNLICATTDPKTGPGGCPISRARFKKDIQYVTPAERTAYAARVLETPLATWRYKSSTDSRKHLGFIIEDVEPSPSVDAARDRVDLYGYTTMVVAALQEQAAEIAALRAEVQALRSAEGPTKSR
jgi:hypothetical protein